jgi:hypothetical protein
MLNDPGWTSVTLRLTPPLKQNIEALAALERRTPENQALCLIENALQVFEGKAREDGPVR